MGGFQLRHHFRAKQQAAVEADQLVGAELERRVHGGDLVVFQRNELTAELVARVRAEIRSCFPELETNWDDLSLWPCRLLEFDKLAQVREGLYSDPKLHQLAARIIASAGFDPVTCVDAPRLRVINHEAEQLPEAAPLFVVHRDTWYACPESQINWWIPIFKTPVEQAFAFYPEHFDREVANTSKSFDYEDWMKRVGWHGRTALDDYPAPTRYEPETKPLRFDFEAGDLLLFSAAHLHRTLPNPVAGSSRVSLDFRTVTPGVRGARNVDNGSGGALERVRREFVPLRYLV
ncbi:MAG: phytanoyl-CoA dioxygenase family protein [Polyangiaceae bacterium]|nr:phytanoyl-CoA dioxygenase family protein [Myxococcales bacterium]MCB9588369.1 phytanoyl-CoA dioxygenase family protein [Polyangiaceae bacterium]